MKSEMPTCVHSIHSLNRGKLNEKYIAVFRKVFSNVSEVMVHADDARDSSQSNVRKPA